MRTVKEGMDWLEARNVWAAASDKSVPGWARTEVALTKSRMGRQRDGEKLLRWFWSAIASAGGKKLGAELRQHGYPSFEGVYEAFTQYMLGR